MSDLQTNQYRASRTLKARVKHLFTYVIKLYDIITLILKKEITISVCKGREQFFVHTEIVLREYTRAIAQNLRTGLLK